MTSLDVAEVRLTSSTADEIPVQVDGEPWGHTPVEVAPIGETLEHVGDFDEDEAAVERADVVPNHLANLLVGLVFEGIDLLVFFAKLAGQIDVTLDERIEALQEHGMCQLAHADDGEPLAHAAPRIRALTTEAAMAEPPRRPSSVA